MQTNPSVKYPEDLFYPALWQTRGDGMENQYTTNLIYRKLDANGDRIFGHNSDDFLSGKEAMKQVLLTRLKSIQGEWWEGDATAIPYFDILGAYGTAAAKERFDLLVLDRINDTVGVTGTDGIESDISKGTYSFSCNVHTVYGEVEVEAEI